MDNSWLPALWTRLCGYGTRRLESRQPSSKGMRSGFWDWRGNLTTVSVVLDSGENNLSY